MFFKKLYFIATLLVALSLCFSFIIAMTVTVKYSFNMAEVTTQSWADEMLKAVSAGIDDWFNKIENAVNSIKTTHASSIYPSSLVIPKNASRQRFDYAIEMMSQQILLMKVNNFAINKVRIAYSDGFYVTCFVNYIKEILGCVYINNLNETKPGVYSKYEKRWDLIKPEKVLEANWKDHYSNFFEAEWYNSTLNNNHDFFFISEIAVSKYDISNFFVCIAFTLYDKSVIRLGTASIDIELRRIARVLEDIPQSSNTEMFIIDNKGYLVGVSNPYLKLYYTVGDTTTNVDNCILINLSSNVTLKRYFCRHTPYTVNCLLINQFYNKYSSKIEIHKQFRVELGSSVYYVKSKKISFKIIKNINWKLVVLVPLDDVAKDIHVGIKISIYATALVLAFSIIISSIMMYFLLRPLNVLAHRMEKASAFMSESNESTRPQPMISSLKELADIQEAFELFSSQLEKAKSFLPKSLIEQLEHRYDNHCSKGCTYDDDDTDFNVLDEQDEGSINLSDTIKKSSYSLNGLENSISYSRSLADYDNFSRSSSLGNGVDNFDLNSSKKNTISYDNGANLPKNRDDSFAQEEVERSSKIINIVSSTLIVKMISIVVFNIRNFNQHLKNLKSLQTFFSFYSLFLDGIDGIAKEHKGILDSFHGDHLTLVFNAIINNRQHVQSAVMAAIKAINEGSYLNEGDNNKIYNEIEFGTKEKRHSSRFAESLSVTDTSMTMTCGIATGPAIVGNIGSCKQRRFHILGSVYSHASVLERLCKLYGGASVLATGGIKQIEKVSHGLYVDVIKLPLTSLSSECLPNNVEKHLNLNIVMSVSNLIKKFSDQEASNSFSDNSWVFESGDKKNLNKSYEKLSKFDVNNFVECYNKYKMRFSAINRVVLIASAGSLASANVIDDAYEDYKNIVLNYCKLRQQLQKLYAQSKGILKRGNEAMKSSDHFTYLKFKEIYSALLMDSNLAHSLVTDVDKDVELLINKLKLYYDNASKSIDTTKPFETDLGRFFRLCVCSENYFDDYNDHKVKMYDFKTTQPVESSKENCIVSSLFNILNL